MPFNPQYNYITLHDMKGAHIERVVTYDYNLSSLSLLFGESSCILGVRSTKVSDAFNKGLKTL